MCPSDGDELSLWMCFILVPHASVLLWDLNKRNLFKGNEQWAVEYFKNGKFEICSFLFIYSCLPRSYFEYIYFSYDKISYLLFNAYAFIIFGMYIFNLKYLLSLAWLITKMWISSGIRRISWLLYNNYPLVGAVFQPWLCWLILFRSSLSLTQRRYLITPIDSLRNWGVGGWGQVTTWSPIPHQLRVPPSAEGPPSGSPIRVPLHEYVVFLWFSWPLCLCFMYFNYPRSFKHHTRGLK